MIILNFDPAKSTGFSVIKIDEASSSGEIIAYGFIEVDDSSPYLGDWCIDFRKKVKDLIEIYKPSVISLEDYFFSSKFAMGAGVNTAFRTVIHVLARDLSMHYEVLNVSSWKIHVCGRSTPTKEQKKKYGKDAKKSMIIEALRDRHGIKLPEFSISKKTNKKIKFRSDISDAIAQSMFAAFSLYKINSFSCDLVVDSL